MKTTADAVVFTRFVVEEGRKGHRGRGSEGTGSHAAQPANARPRSVLIVDPPGFPRVDGSIPLRAFYSSQGIVTYAQAPPEVTHGPSGPRSGATTHTV